MPALSIEDSYQAALTRVIAKEAEYDLYMKVIELRLATIHDVEEENLYLRRVHTMMHNLLVCSAGNDAEG